jgi:hypothetical protein
VQAEAWSNGRQGCHTDDAERRGRHHGAVAGLNCVADVFVKIGEGGRADDDLVGGSEGMALRDRRTVGCVRLHAHHRHGLAVDTQRIELRAAPRHHVGVGVEQGVCLLLRDEPAAGDRVEFGVPVPPGDCGRTRTRPLQ